MVRIISTATNGFTSQTAALIFLPLIFLLITSNLQAQDEQGRRRVEILNSDSMKYERVDGMTRNRMNGNVRLMHNDLYMNCDSAWYFIETNVVLAYNNIHIWQTQYTYADNFCLITATQERR